MACVDLWLQLKQHVFYVVSPICAHICTCIDINILHNYFKAHTHILICLSTISSLLALDTASKYMMTTNIMISWMMITVKMMMMQVMLSLGDGEWGRVVVVADNAEPPPNYGIGSTPSALDYLPAMRLMRFPYKPI